MQACEKSGRVQETVFEFGEYLGKRQVSHEMNPPYTFTLLCGTKTLDFRSQISLCSKTKILVALLEKL